MEIAAIITGILSVLAGFLPGLPAGRRALAILGGAGFAIYGIYVLNQDTGTWQFPIYLFLLPVFILGSVAFADRGHDG
jgi:hypothetical protein